ncbi:MAG: carbohydrate kinase [Actinomycetia bacterium]|nr:carbohydrate kinase [Actinomycetes bacterium]
MSSILTIDQGTSSTKAIVVVDGEVAAIADEPVRPAYLEGGGVEQDPQELLDSVLGAGRRAVEQAGKTVDAVALANQGETVLAWDESTGTPLSPAIVWQDRRSESICAALAEHADWVAQRTGLELDPYFSAPKMAWVRANLTRGGVVTTTDTWLVHHLCGAFVTDASTASRSLLVDIDTVEWDPELCALFGLETEKLPRIVGCDEIVGTTKAFGPEVPVTGLIVDQQAALAAQSCLQPGMAKCTFGTGAFLLANIGQSAVRSAAGLTTSVAWRTEADTSYCVDGQIYTAASAVRWARDLGLVGDASELDTVAAEDAGRVLFVPAFAGLAAPWWDAKAGASITGMTLATGREHIVRALLDGIAAQVTSLARLVEADLGSRIERLRVDGGLTQSSVLMQMQADLLQVPVDVYPSANATPLGAAAFARLAIGDASTLDDAVGEWSAERTYEPAWRPDRVAEYLERWSAAERAAVVKGGSKSEL